MEYSKRRKIMAKEVKIKKKPGRKPKKKLKRDKFYKLLMNSLKPNGVTK